MVPWVPRLALWGAGPLTGEACSRQRAREEQKSESDGVNEPTHLAPSIHGSMATVAPYRSTRRNRSALPMTDTELKLIAAAAIIGDSSSPKNGYRTPAATGTPAAL